jgi:hypothetical protein
MVLRFQSFLGAEVIEPGRCVLLNQGHRRSHLGPRILDYWLAVVCPESMLPTKVAQRKPAVGVTSQNGPFPVWLIGKSEL